MQLLFAIIIFDIYTNWMIKVWHHRIYFDNIQIIKPLESIVLLALLKKNNFEFNKYKLITN